MRCTILRLPRQSRPVVFLAALLGLTNAAPVAAHEIPARVTVIAYAKPEAGRLRVLVRAPLEAMRDVDFPQRGPGYLDLVRARGLAHEAAQLWIADYIRAFENGSELTRPKLVATRISIPSDRAFGSYGTALATVTGAPLDTAIDIPWTQAALDVLMEFPISSADSRFAVDARFGRLGIETNTVLKYVAPDGAERAYQYRGDAGIVNLDPAWYHAGWQFIRLGITHILGGIDHLLFVFCLVIPFRRVKQLVLIITAFTVAHSITLVSAALGVVPNALWFPPLVEMLIAASIVYMALENIVGTKLQRRWLVAFGFGLVHGFGFSFALAESLQFAGSHLAISLFTFNLGVEIGQLLVLAAAVPLVSWLLTHVVAERVGVIILSAFVAHTAWHWMTERGSRLGEYAFTWPAWDLALAASATRAALVLVIIGAAAWGLTELYRRIDGSRPEPETQS